MKSTIVHKAVHDFLQALRQRNASVHTIKAYTGDLAEFSAYIGPRGWVGYYTDLGTEDWDEVHDLIVESYRLAAPKRLAAQLP